MLALLWTRNGKKNNCLQHMQLINAVHLTRCKLLRGPRETHFNREASLDAPPSLQFAALCVGGYRKGQGTRGKKVPTTGARRVDGDKKIESS